MKILPMLQPILADLTDRFGPRLQAVRPVRPNEVYIDAPMDLIAGFCAQLYRKWGGRLVCLFADDPRPAVDAFHLYYVFALDGAHGFIIARVPVPPPLVSAFTSPARSLTAMPPPEVFNFALNWAGTRMVNFPSLRLRQMPNQRLLTCFRSRMVRVVPSCRN